jgi:hypothetical protein
MTQLNIPQDLSCWNLRLRVISIGYGLRDIFTSKKLETKSFGTLHTQCYLRTALFWVIKQRVVVMAQKGAVLIHFAVEA